MRVHGLKRVETGEIQLCSQRERKITQQRPAIGNIACVAPCYPAKTGPPLMVASSDESACALWWRPGVRTRREVAMNAVLVLLLLPSAHSIALRAAWGRAIGVVAPVVHHFVEPHQLQATTLDRLTNVAIPSDEGREVLAFAARPADGSTGPRPVLVLLHEFFGLSESIVDKAQGLADELGCLVVAPDVFRGVTTDFIPRAIWLALSTPQPRVNADLDAVLRWAAAQGDVDAERVAVMGFCFGGGKAIGYTTQANTPTWQRLQPRVLAAATPCMRGCDPLQRLQPYAEAATLCRGCNTTCCRRGATLRPWSSTEHR